MPPQERLHEGLGGLGDCFTCSGVVIRRRAVSGETARGGFDFLFCGGGAVAVCFEGCCGSMCWPVDRPATHAAAGAAARGVRGDWGIVSHAWEWSFGAVPSQERRHEEVLIFCFVGGALLPFVLRACCGSMCWPVGRPATHAAAGQARNLGGGIPLFIWHCTEYAYLPAILRAGVELKFRNDGGGGAIFGYNSLSNAASSSARPRRL